jgi:hypothetical protein
LSIVARFMLVSVQARLGDDGLGQAIACVDADSSLDLVVFSSDVACTKTSKNKERSQIWHERANGGWLARG